MLTAAEFERRMKAGDITVVPPEDVTIEWVNKRTGEVSQIPEGIQPGFDYNPSLKKTIRDGLLKVGLQKLDKLPAPIRQAAMSPVVREGVSDEFANAVTGAYAALPINARHALAASGYEVRVVGRLIDEQPELQRKIPAGYPASLDYRHVDGLTLTTEKLILIYSLRGSARLANYRPGLVVLARRLIAKLPTSPARQTTRARLRSLPNCSRRGTVAERPALWRPMQPSRIQWPRYQYCSTERGCDDRFAGLRSRQ